MDGGGALVQTPDKVGPVVDHQRTRLGHTQVEVVQRVQQGGVVRPVPQNAGLMLVQPVVLRQGGGISGPQLTDGAVQKPPPRRRAVPDQSQILRTEQHRGQHPGQLPALFSRTPLE